MTSFQKKQTLKNGRTLKVIRVSRISTVNQDERSLDDQKALHRNYVKDHIHSGATEYTDIASQGSGEILDREELERLDEFIQTGKYDLVICEDLARICRRAMAMYYCELCEDFDTRLVAINDGVDTVDDGWRDNAYISTWHHERSNKDTSQRIKRTLRNRFITGSVLRKYGPFYLVPDNATTIADFEIKPEAIEIVEHGISMLENGASYSAVADWLNETGFPIGGKSKTGKWDGRLVKRRFRDPCLKGEDFWNKTVTKRVNCTGRHKKIKAPPELQLFRDCPHLAFIDAARFDRLMKMLDLRNSHYARGRDAANRDPLNNRPRKRTRFPGQMIFCGICGRNYVFGAHGQNDNLMCNGAREYKCWNGISVDGPLAASKIAAAVHHEIETLPDFDTAFLEVIHESARQLDGSRRKRIDEVQKTIRLLERKKANFLSFIGGGDQSKSVRESLAETEEELEELLLQIAILDQETSEILEIPTIEELKTQAREILNGDSPYSFEFQTIMKGLIPKIVVFPVRLIDGGHLELRARFRISLGNLSSNKKLQEVLKKPLERTLTVHLDDPPQREEYRKQVVALRRCEARRWTEREIARHLGISQPAVQYAMSLQRKMDQLGIDDPYQPVAEPPEDYRKLRRHRHKRYEFDPLPDAGQF